MQRDIVELSSKSIDAAPFKEREHASLAIAFDPKILPEVKEKIDTFWKDLDQFIEDNNSKREEVYQLSVGFFPLTRSKK